VHIADATEAWTRAGIFGALPIQEGTYMFASCATPELSRAINQRDLIALRSAWRDTYALADRLLAAVPHFDDLLIHEVIRVDCARWFDGRLVLVGDAAHAMAPNLGQGANSALVDAAVLVHALRSHADIGAAIAAYDARRREKVRAVADASARLGKLSEATHPVARALRDGVLMPLLRRLPTGPQLRMLLQETPGEITRLVHARAELCWS
jgi:2-polyprenyl-6-methoxyphenol hydroxylase-like FAD-dependent oxidoreductase